MGFYSEIPYEEFGYYDTPSTHEVGGSILTGILMFYLIILLVGLTVAVVITSLSRLFPTHPSPCAYTGN